MFECKAEIDSWAHWLALSTKFYESTGSLDFLNDRWYTALNTVMAALEEQSMPTFDEDDSRFVRNEYTFSRNTNTGTETLSLEGVGNPMANGTGLVRSPFR